MFDPYGRVTVLDGNGTPRTVNESLYGNPWTFTGRRLDQETGLMYFRNRMYETGLGRFCQRDPIGYVDGYGLYTGYFVPGGLDPSGLELDLPCYYACMDNYIGNAKVLELTEPNNAKWQADCTNKCTKMPNQPIAPVRNGDDTVNSKPQNNCPCRPISVIINNSGATKVQKITRKGIGGGQEEYSSPFGALARKWPGLSDKPELGSTGNVLPWKANHFRVEIIINFDINPLGCSIRHEFFDKYENNFVLDADPGQMYDEYNAYVVGNQMFIYDGATTGKTRRLTVTSSDRKTTIVKEYRTFE